METTLERFERTSDFARTNPTPTPKLAAAMFACALTSTLSIGSIDSGGKTHVLMKSWRLDAAARTGDGAPWSWVVIEQLPFVPKTALAKKLFALRQQIKKSGAIIPAQQILSELAASRAD